LLINEQLKEERMEHKYITASDAFGRNGRYYTEAEKVMNVSLANYERQLIEPLINRIFARLLEENNAGTYSKRKEEEKETPEGRG